MRTVASTPEDVDEDDFLGKTERYTAVSGLFFCSRPFHRVLNALQDALNALPPVINYFPLRAPILLNWKRSFGLRFPPQSLGDALADFRNARNKQTLYNGDFSGTFYMIENFVVYAGQLGVALSQKEAMDPKAKEAANMAVRAAVMTALHPLSHASTWAIVSDERIGLRRALEQMRNEGVPLWNGVGERVMVAMIGGLVRDHVTLPAATELRLRVFGPGLTTAQVLQMPINRPSMMRRVRSSIADIYQSSVSSLSLSALLYPLECVRMRVESQYAVFHKAKYAGVLDCCRKVLAEEGVGGFYRGFYSWALLAPVEIVWPLMAWAVASLVVHAVFEEEADDEDDEPAAARQLNFK